MQIDDGLLDRLQKLGMIEIAQDKREEIKGQLSEILDFVKNLESVGTEGIEVHADRSTPLRKDEVMDAQIREDVLSILNHSCPRICDSKFILSACLAVITRQSTVSTLNTKIKSSLSH